MAGLSRTLRAALLAALLGTTVSSSAAGQEWREFRAARQASDIRSLDVELAYAAGRLTIHASDVPLLYDAHLRYDAERFEPLRAWSRDADRGRLRIGLSSVEAEDGEHSARLRLEDWDVEFDLKNLSGGGDAPGDLDLALHPEVRTRLNLKVGAAKTRLRLGGLTLESLDFATGASEAHLQFETPNRIPMKRLSLRSAAAKFRAEDLGNARFRDFEFQGAVGDVRLDFSGDWRESARAHIKMALGELQIVLPRGVGVRILRESLLAPLEIDGFRREGDAYYSSDWDSADVRLDIELEAGLVGVKVERG